MVGVCARRIAGAHRRHLAVARIGMEIVFSMGILIFLFGMLLAGFGEAWMLHSRFWLTVFGLGIAGDVYLYFRTVWYGLQWLQGYEPVDRNVVTLVGSPDDSAAGHHHHSGEH